MSAPEMTERQRENAELVRRYLRYLQDGRMFALADEVETFIHPEIEWYPGLLPLGKQVHRGREEFRQYLEAAERRAGSPPGYLNVDEVRPVGEDAVIALGWVHHVGAGGESLDNDYALLIGLEDGLFRTMRSFYSREDAEQAAAELA